MKEQSEIPFTENIKVVGSDDFCESRGPRTTQDENKTPSTLRARDNDFFHFEKLPAEVRNIIYEWVSALITKIRIHRSRPNPRVKTHQTYYLRSAVKIASASPNSVQIEERLPYIVDAHSAYEGSDLGYNSLVSLLFTSRTICLEFAPFVYRRLHHFYEPESITPYLLHQPSWAWAHIKSVSLQTEEFSPRHTRNFRNACKMIRKNLKLERLVIHVRVITELGLWETDYEDILETREWARQLVKITGLKELTLDIDLDWEEKQFLIFDDSVVDYVRNLLAERMCRS